MARNLWEILADGGDTRKILEMNSSGTPGVSFPQSILDEYNVDYGDRVAVEFDEDAGELTVFFPPNDGA